jgi:hypothetical protein
MHYYAITLAAPIPHGSSILNKPCRVSVQQAFDNGVATIMEATGTVFAWQQQNLIVIQTVFMNLPNFGGVVKIEGVDRNFTAIVPR